MGLVNLAWPLAVALVGVQVVLAVIAFVALCLPLSNVFARRVQRKRVHLLWIGAGASVWPLVYFGQLAAELGVASYVAHLGTSFVWLVVQVLLFYAEDRRAAAASAQRFDSRLRGQGELR